MQYELEQQLRNYNVPPPPPHLQGARMQAPKAMAKGVVAAVTLASSVAKASSQSTVIGFTEATPVLNLLLRAVVDELIKHPGHYLSMLMLVLLFIMFLLMLLCAATAQTYHKYKLLQLSAAAAVAPPREDPKGDPVATSSGGASSSCGASAADLSPIVAHRGNPEFQQPIKHVRTVGVMSPVHYTFGTPEPRYFHQTQGFSRAWEVDIGTPFPLQEKRCKCNHCSRNLD